MDPCQMVEQHVASGAGATVAAIRQPISLADQFGVIETAAGDQRLIGAFREKPTDAVGLPDAPDEIYASMGNYVFRTDALLDALARDAADEGSKHDMGGNIVPMMVERKDAAVYDFRDNVVAGASERDRGYWRDVGTLDAFYEAHQDLIAVSPIFNLYNYEWPIYTTYDPLPPAKFVTPSTAASGTPSTRSSPPAPSSRARTSRTRPVAEGRRPLLGAGERVGPHGRRPGGPLRRRAQRDRRQGRHDPGELPDRARPGARPGSRASRSRPGGITVIGKGQKVPV
jgi:hypothetical protein